MNNFDGFGHLVCQTLSMYYTTNPAIGPPITYLLTLLIIRLSLPNPTIDTCPSHNILTPFRAAQRPLASYWRLRIYQHTSNQSPTSSGLHHAGFGRYP